MIHSLASIFADYCPRASQSDGSYCLILAGPSFEAVRVAVLYFETRYMIFSREYVGYLARRAVQHLIDAKMISTDKVKQVEERVYQAMLEELSLEDRINEEVRVILEAYQEEMRRTGASYPEMFKKVKMELARKYKAVL
ncbi:conserved domain protein [Acidobacterium capsulatum ATCC 51196]|uniref:Conserved domain protein n=2 Tax=Acidobacteriaceae TaxID=204434 RepID=C1F3K7_ACIC5|nr:conserved domain protein [Acidobacterium capsulatum ATCC 51196]